ncbi:hypothetical protein MGH68_16525 [Erysipelothrix sp. D19-032]
METGLEIQLKQRLSVWAEVVGLNATELLAKHTRLNEVPFDSGRKRMSTINDIDGVKTVFVKGGVDEILSVVKYMEVNGEILPISDDYIARIQENNKAMGSKALRVLALAKKIVNETELEASEIESDLVFVGIVGMIDPPRPKLQKRLH